MQTNLIHFQKKLFALRWKTIQHRTTNTVSKLDVKLYYHYSSSSIRIKHVPLVLCPYISEVSYF
jgi:hypothetical protein